MIYDSRFLDKAAIKEEDDNVSSHASRWRLCTVHQIEELKSLLRMAPIWTTTILVSTVIVQQGTFSVQQARSMNRFEHSRLFTPIVVLASASVDVASHQLAQLKFNIPGLI